MSIDEIKKKFIVDDDVLKTRLEAIATKALEHCVLDKKGNVHFNNPKLRGAEKLRLTLAARAVAAQMDPNISAEVSIEELVANSGMPENQVRARASELVRDRVARSDKPGMYAALPHKVETLLDSLNQKAK